MNAAMKRGLVLEGGGMRGLFTAGVLDYFMDEGITFDYCIGVSAGACHASSYLSQQRGRSYRINTAYLGDGRYLGVKNLLRTGSMFGMDFIFDEIPNRLDPFDYDTFLKNPCEFVAGVTDVQTGKPAYFGMEAMDHDATVLRASSAIPVFSPIVEFRGRKFLDGGTSDPIPLEKALRDGCERLVIVLTQDRTYEKSPEKFRGLYKRLYARYPAMAATLDRRHQVYNEARRRAFQLEKEGKAVIIAPVRPVGISRFEKDAARLRALYEAGFAQARFTVSTAAPGFFRP